MTSEPAPAESPLVRLLADVGAVIAVVTAVLYYFGWVRTRFQARVLGFDVAAMNLTTTDYLLKSLNVLFLPLIALICAALAARWVHQSWLGPGIGRLAPAYRRRVELILGLAWLPVIVMLPVAVTGFVVPFVLTVALLLGRYGRSLRRERTGTDPWPPATRILLLVLLLLAVFWSTERVARATGEAFGRDFAADPFQLPAVVLYSEKDLLLTGPGVIGTVLTGPEAAYRHRYTGLYLLERSGDQSFYLTAVPGRVIVLRDADTVRVEFVRTPG